MGRVWIDVFAGGVAKCSSEESHFCAFSAWNKYCISNIATCSTFNPFLCQISASQLKTSNPIIHQDFIDNNTLTSCILISVFSVDGLLVV